MDEELVSRVKKAAERSPVSEAAVAEVRQQWPED
jgi:hypothetical protein